MQLQTDPHSTASPARTVASMLRLVGWVSFWTQLVLMLVAAIALLFVFSGRNVSEQPSPGIGIGIFWAGCGIVALLVNLYQTFRYTRLSKRFRNPDPALQPKKTDTMQVVRWSVVIGIVGMLLALLGTGATIGTLLAKTVALPQGVAIYDPSRIIRAMDVFTAAANLDVLAAHYLNMVASLWLLGWLHRQ